MHKRRAILLVGHGGVPSDYPREKLLQLKRLEGQRRASGAPISGAERELDSHIRNWPRSALTDPYSAGIEELRTALSKQSGIKVQLAYNEFCSPDIQLGISLLVEQGYTHIDVITSMVTRGGSHAEIEIPEELEQCRLSHPDVSIRYAWPYPPESVARMMVQVLESSRQDVAE